MIVCWNIMYAIIRLMTKEVKVLIMNFYLQLYWFRYAYPGSLKATVLSYYVEELISKIKYRRNWKSRENDQTEPGQWLEMMCSVYTWLITTKNENYTPGSSAWSFWNIHDGSQCNNSAIMNVWPQYKGVSSWSSPAKTEFLFTAMTQWTQHSSKANLHNHSANAWI